MTQLSADGVIRSYRRARQRRRGWEDNWRECYQYALPQRGGGALFGNAGHHKTDHLFDATAADAVDQLAASLLAHLTPPWSQWFGFAAGHDMSPDERDILAPELERAASVLHSHFNLSNFAVEVHQCYLDLVTAGTACLLMEETPPGTSSAFRFTAVPLSQVVLEESVSGCLDTTYRRSELTTSEIASRFPGAVIDSPSGVSSSDDDEEKTIGVIEAVVPDGSGYAYMAVAEADAASGSNPCVLAEGRFVHSPFINFRWLRAPGEHYGRSPVMKVLPDVKTANKVVELILKNASIAVTGIWQADDDGVLNPATIKLIPGTIIPKAVGSAGLTPLEAPGRFDVSQLVLEDLRSQIRTGLLADKLGQINAPRMTATEVLERSAEMARILGATYGRLQSELLTPVVSRGLAILSRRGEIPEIAIDGRLVELEYKSPLARQQAREDARSTLLWLDAVKALGPDALATIDGGAAARWLARSFGVPAPLVREEITNDNADLSDLVDGLVSVVVENADDVAETGGDHDPS